MKTTSTMVSQQTNEVDEIIKDLKRYPGFKAYIILNKDGIVIKWEQVGSPMPYQKAVQHSYLVLDLCDKSKAHMCNLFEPPDDQVESIRLRTDEYEMIVAQHGNFTLIVLQVDESKATSDGNAETAE